MSRKPRELTDEERREWQEAMHGSPKPRAVAKPTDKPVVSAKKSKAASPPSRPSEPLFPARRKVEIWIDLHGMTLAEAHEALNSFIARAERQGKRRLAIITGKGQGVLKREVPRWLELTALARRISAISHAPAEKGGEGVLYVLLKKP